MIAFSVGVKQEPPMIILKFGESSDRFGDIVKMFWRHKACFDDIKAEILHSNR